jgi:hypothetical protein
MDQVENSAPDHLIPDDFLSWILLDLENKNQVPSTHIQPANKSFEKNPLIIAESSMEDMRNIASHTNMNKFYTTFGNSSSDNPMMYPDLMTYQNIPAQHIPYPQQSYPQSYTNQYPLYPIHSNSSENYTYDQANKIPRRQQNYRHQENSTIPLQNHFSQEFKTSANTSARSMEDMNSLHDSMDGEDDSNDDSNSHNYYDQDQNFTTSSQHGRAPSHSTSNNSKARASSQMGQTPRSKDLAKACRKRQRDRLEEMENRIKVLSEENKELQAHINNVTLRTTEVQKQRSEMVNMPAMLLSHMLICIP